MLACAIESFCDVVEKQTTSQGRASLARVQACEVVSALEIKSACEVTEEQTQGRASLDRVSAREVMLACEIKSADDVMEKQINL